MSASHSLSDRVTELESIVMHLQHDLDQMHAVILTQHADFEQLLRTVHRLDERLLELLAEPEARDRQQERPPHY